MPAPGAELALNLLGGFRALADEGTKELEALGYHDIRPSHDFALRAIAAGADSAQLVAARTGVTKQAAARTVAALEERGLITRSPDTTDARRVELLITDRARSLMTDGERVFDELRAQWERRVGAERFAAFESVLAELADGDGMRFDPRGVPGGLT